MSTTNNQKPVDKKAEELKVSAPAIVIKPKTPRPVLMAIHL